MRQTLENLRERPREEKTAIATSVSLAVVGVLFIAWLIYFFHTIRTATPPDLQSVNPLNSNGLQQADQQFRQAYGSTTQFIESASGTLELEEVSTTTFAQ